MTNLNEIMEQDIVKLKIFQGTRNAKLKKIWGTEKICIEIEGQTDMRWEYDQYNMTFSEWQKKADDFINSKIKFINKIVPNYECRSCGMEEKGQYSIYLHLKQ
jgi:hypothetical protein